MDLFEGNYKKPRKVNLNPVKNTSEAINSSTTSRLIKKSNAEIYQENLKAKRQQRELHNLKTNAVTKIASYYRMYKVRKDIKDQLLAINSTESSENLLINLSNPVQKSLLEVPHLLNSSDAKLLLNSLRNEANPLSFFAFLLSIQNSNDQNYIRQNCLRLNRNIQNFSSSQFSALNRLSESWFLAAACENHLLCELDILMMPWILVRNSNSIQQDDKTKLKILCHLLIYVITQNLELNQLAKYLDGYLCLSEVNQIRSIFSPDIFIHTYNCRRPSLYQSEFHKIINIPKLSPEIVLQLFAFCKIEDENFGSINSAMNILVDTLLISLEKSRPQPKKRIGADRFRKFNDDEDQDKMEISDSESDDDYSEDESENESSIIPHKSLSVEDMYKIPPIIRIFNQIDPKIFLMSNLNLDSLGKLIAALFKIYPNIDHISILQTFARNDKILKKYINNLINNLENKTAIQIRKYIKKSEDFTTWFVLLWYRLSMVRDELWLSRDKETCKTVIEIFGKLIGHLKSLVITCSNYATVNIGSSAQQEQNSGQISQNSGIPSALLAIINRLGDLNTIRPILTAELPPQVQNQNTTVPSEISPEQNLVNFEITQLNHPLVQRLRILTHPTQNSQNPFMESLNENSYEQYQAILARKDASKNKKSSSASIINHRKFKNLGLKNLNGVNNSIEIWLLSVIVFSPSLMPLDLRVLLLFKLSDNYKPHRASLNANFQGSKISIRRDHIYQDAFEQVLKSPLTHFLSIRFIDVHGKMEEGAGRGVNLEFINCFIKEAFSKEKQLFKETQSGTNALYPNPDVFKVVPDALQHYYVIGKLLGSCILSKIQICAPICKFVMKEIFCANYRPSISDLAEMDPELFQNLMALKDANPEDVSNYDLDFTYSIGKDDQTVELVENGANIQVTKENRLFYIEKIAQLKLSRGMERQLQAIKEGVQATIPLHWFQLFNTTEIEFLFYGKNLDLDTDEFLKDWRENTVVESGQTSNSVTVPSSNQNSNIDFQQTVALFWDIVKKDFSSNDRRALMKFSTSLLRPPLLGFKDLDPKFTIMKMSGDDQALPRSATCVNTLYLAPIVDREVLKQKLLLAIHEVDGFELEASILGPYEYSQVNRSDPSGPSTEQTMGSLFRSEKMELIQMILNSEASYLCVAELGELGCLQFRDLNENINSFEKKYTRDIRRCDEMERQIRFINSELKNSKIGQLWNGSGSSVNSNVGYAPKAPLPSEMAKLEEELQTIEGEIREVNKNYEALKTNFSAVKEVSHVLKKSEAFMVDTMYQSQDLSLSFGNNQSSSSAIGSPETNNLSSSAKLNFTAGTIARNRVNILEKILWRACHGKVLLRTYDINDDSLTDINNEPLEKSVFIVVYQGQTLQSKVKKIAEGIRATVYPIPEEPSERRNIELKIRSQIEDAQAVISQTEQHRTKLLTACSRQVKDWYQKIMKAKSIYHIHNMLTTGNGSTLIGEAWCPTTELENVKNALRIGTESSGSAIPNIMEVMRSKRVPPTYHRTNKFTAGFQGLIDAYGICTYQEVNPTPFTIISFPFLFGVMFGDIGHGIIMTAMALYLVLKERQLQNIDSDIFKMIFGGRYIVLMMGIFSTYCGFIYNDAFSKSFNLFGSTWSATDYEIPEKEGASVALDPNRTDTFHGPYFYGVDPIWQLTVNKILWSNSFKMKASIVFGIIQMVFGLLLKLENSRYFQNKLNVVAEWIPEMIFLNSIFSYLVLTILGKWMFWPSSDSACAPSLLINLINIFMLKSSEKCTGNPNFSGGTPTYLYPGQDFVQKLLLLCAMISIPWLLIMKPYVLYQRNKRRVDRSTGNFGGIRVSLDIGDNDRQAIMDFDHLDREQELGNGQTTTYDEVNNENDNGDGKPKDQNEEFNMQEVVIYQIIHTIEFCLSCISHTASYLRLWALSLAHAQLSEVLWSMLLSFSLKSNSVIIKWVVFFFFSTLTVGILIAMEGLSAFLHALRLHWVEFNSKFFKGEGHAFKPFSFQAIFSAPENEI